MKSKRPVKRRAYRSELRQRQAADTRELILQAFGEQMAATGPEGLSVPDVARRAGVSVRTIYRHFGGRAQLFDALQGWVAAKALPPPPRDIKELLAYPEALFTAFDRHAPWVMAMLRAGPGAELREAGHGRRVAMMRSLVSTLTGGLGEETTTMAAGVFKHLLSAEAWHLLRKDFGLDGPRAGRAVRWALEALADDLHRQGRAAGRRADP
ncbi:MAG: TetR/AcrR family transcriptional regulator [Polyangiaceae bacterium]|nr:TetR/AcrR family transcriptional regulator [Polyangiaceae bacterium]